MIDRILDVLEKVVFIIFMTVFVCWAILLMAIDFIIFRIILLLGALFYLPNGIIWIITGKWIYETEKVLDKYCKTTLHIFVKEIF